MKIINMYSAALAAILIAIYMIGCSQKSTSLRDSRSTAISKTVYQYGLQVASNKYSQETDQQFFAAGFLGGFMTGLIEEGFRPTITISEYSAVMNDGRSYGYRESTTNRSQSQLKSIQLEDFGYHFISTKGVVKISRTCRALLPDNLEETWLIIPNRDFCDKAQCLLPDGNFSEAAVVARVSLSGYLSPIMPTNGLMKDYPREFAVKQVHSLERMESPKRVVGSD